VDHGRPADSRAWQGDPENLAASLLLTTDLPPAETAQIAFVAALAAGDLAAAFAPPMAVSLKWPNDVLIEGAKACGILIESGARADGDRWLAVGIGANLARAPRDTSYRATAIADHGSAPSPQAALEVLDQAFAWWLETWEAQGFEPVRQAWMARAHGLGQPASVAMPGRTISGLIEGLDADGALLLRGDHGTLTRITAGDVIFGVA